MNAKASTRKFWRKTWRYGVTVERWFYYMKRNDSVYVPHYTARNRDLAKKAIRTMHIDRLITMEEMNNLITMINSPDDENILVALYAMKAIKPKLFKS